MVKAGGEPHRDRASGFGRPQRQRAGQARAGLGARPRTAPSAPGTPGAAFRAVPGLGLGEVRLERSRPPGCWRAWRGNKWARMPYEISECAGGPGGRARLPDLGRVCVGRVRPATRSADRDAGRRPPSPGSPRSCRCGLGRAGRTPALPWALAPERGLGSGAGPCAPGKWRPPLP
jgi:hypothetical protein